jgi:hypothetical protein
VNESVEREAGGLEYLMGSKSSKTEYYECFITWSWFVDVLFSLASFFSLRFFWAVNRSKPSLMASNGSYLTEILEMPIQVG